MELADIQPLGVFRLEGQRYGLPLSQIDRVIRAVELTSLPKAPSIVLGVVNVNGQVLPVLDIRHRFHLPDREIGVDDHFLIARTRKRRVVLQIDQAEGVIGVSANDVVCTDEITPGLEQVRGVAKLADGLLLIHDIDSFLSLEEEQALDDALGEEARSGT